MREKGSPSTPKELKKSTIYAKILILGEPMSDTPIDECLGEIGVICFQITVLSNKKTKKRKKHPFKRKRLLHNRSHYLINQKGYSK